MTNPSFRSQLVTRRTYSREKDDGNHETWPEIVERAIEHQRWLWIEAKGGNKGSLMDHEEAELSELRSLMLERKATLSGRTLWLGGTETAKKFAASQFNCAFLEINSVYDMVDAFWLLLQGCGVGFKPVNGTLSGFTKKCYVEACGVYFDHDGYDPSNKEDYYIDKSGNYVWHLAIGDSAQAWAKSLGKLLAMKKPVDVIKLDFGEIRKPGIKLKGYGWVSQGYTPLMKAYLKIAEILNNRAGKLLTKMDILDIMNLVGTTLSSRRSAQIALMDYDDPEIMEFIDAKKDLVSNPHRVQSNNSILFYERPSKLELKAIFSKMAEAGGSEPGFINAKHAKERAPWFKGVNPCAEILLGNKSFCNLVEIDVSKFKEDGVGLRRAAYIMARANYRQTCVNLKDGVLSDSWHELNDYLRLCGVGITGIAKRGDVPYPLLRDIKEKANEGARDMASELRLPLPKLVTTIKPSGTLSKVMDTTEGIHKPLGKFIFNNISFGKNNPILKELEEANYRIFENPYDEESVLVQVPVKYDGVEFDTIDGVSVNNDAATTQLLYYFKYMDQYVDHNCSITVSYSPDEVDDIINKIHSHWDEFVGVSWLYRNDPTKTAEDLGYAYLPQEVVDEATYLDYVSNLKPVTIGNNYHESEEELEDECEGGACPVR